MTVVLYQPNRRKFYIGLSTDSKPTDEVTAGSEFFETDTKATYIFDGSAWTTKT